MNSHGMHLTNCFLNPCFVFHSKQNILSAVKVYEYTLYQIQKLDKAITKFLRNILPVTCLVTPENICLISSRVLLREDLEKK